MTQRMWKCRIGQGGYRNTRSSTALTVMLFSLQVHKRPTSASHWTAEVLAAPHKCVAAWLLLTHESVCSATLHYTASGFDSAAADAPVGDHVLQPLLVGLDGVTGQR